MLERDTGATRERVDQLLEKTVSVNPDIADAQFLLGVHASDDGNYTAAVNRLKEAVRLSRDLETRPDHDYVVMAEREALRRRFDLLQADLIRAFSLVHSSAARSAPTRRSNDRDKRR